MPGNRRIFEEATRTGANLAWEGKWPQAVEAYRRALAEFPDDVSALVSLGMALTEVNQLEEALTTYQRAANHSPKDPTLFERIAGVLQRAGKGEDACTAYVQAGNLYLSERQAPQLALERWQDAVRAWPDAVQPHVELLRAYQRSGQVLEAIGEYLELARVYQAQGQVEQALQICRHALQLDARNPAVLAAIDYLHAGRPLESRVYEREQVQVVGQLLVDDKVQVDVPAERSSPVEITRQRALTDLAEAIFEDEISPSGRPSAPALSKAELDAMIGRAIDLQTRGDIDGALDAYEQAVQAGVQQPAAHFNLGLLYQEKLRFDEAIEQFQHSVQHPEYVLGSHFALGECYRARGKVDEALEHFIEAVKIVDLTTVRRDQADDLTQLYASLADSYLAKGEHEPALEFTNSLVDFLSAKGWEDKALQVRERLDAIASEGPILSLAEMLAMPNAEQVVESLALSQEFNRRGMPYAAIEEAYAVLVVAPEFLLIHHWLGEVWLSMGMTEEAMAKFLMLGDVLRVRGDVHQASRMYERALKLAPMDVAVRARLIDLLISHGEIDQALEHYLLLADTYYQLAQLDRAREKYQEALQLVPRSQREQRWKVRILHKMGDIDMQRIDWRRAVGIYEQIRQTTPEDEKAALTLVELYYRLGHAEKAVFEIDSLIKLYRSSGKEQKILAVLEDAVQGHPDSIPLRTRLAQAYLNAGLREQALQHLDTLGDLQIGAGRTEDAVATIRAIIALKPPNVDAYRQLLVELS